MLKIFIATSDKNNTNLDALMEKKSQFIVTHPMFDLTTDYGKFVTTEIGEEFKPTGNPVLDILNKDYWLIAYSDLLIYDLDSNPGTHYISTAILNGKKIVGVSELMKGVEPIFSQHFEIVCKPGSLDKVLTNMYCVKPSLEITKKDGEK